MEEKSQKSSNPCHLEFIIVIILEKNIEGWKHTWNHVWDLSPWSENTLSFKRTIIYFPSLCRWKRALVKCHALTLKHFYHFWLQNCNFVYTWSFSNYFLNTLIHLPCPSARTKIFCLGQKRMSMAKISIISVEMNEKLLFISGKYEFMNFFWAEERCNSQRLFAMLNGFDHVC